jgi:hypothetical protein
LGSIRAVGARRTSAAHGDQSRTALTSWSPIIGAGEYREPAEQEWQDFQARKLELGECGQPYGTRCRREHACIGSPSLRVDPAARPRLVQIQNLRDRIVEARSNGWLGEVEGLQVSLNAAVQRLVAGPNRSGTRLITSTPHATPVSMAPAANAEAPAVH